MGGSMTLNYHIFELKSLIMTIGIMPNKSRLHTQCGYKLFFLSLLSLYLHIIRTTYNHFSITYHFTASRKQFLLSVVMKHSNQPFRLLAEIHFLYSVQFSTSDLAESRANFAVDIFPFRNNVT